MKLECRDGTIIEYRLPNVIELLDLKHKCSIGSEDTTAHSMISTILQNTEPFIIKVKGKKDFKECLEHRALLEDLSQLALNLIKDDVSEDEKK
jgi:hypothetical protein